MESPWKRGAKPAEKAEALSKNYLCKVCQALAVKAVVFDNGAAFMPTCDTHLDETVGVVTTTLAYGPPDAITELGGPGVEKAAKAGAMVIVSKSEAEEIRKLHSIPAGLTPIEQRDGDDDDDA